MSLINIPAYLYFQGVQGNKPVNVQVYTSNYLVNKASLLATNEKESYTVSNAGGISDDIASVANGWLGEYVFTPKLDFYSVYVEGQTPSIGENVTKGLSYLNVTNHWLTTTLGHTAVERVASVNGSNIGMYTPSSSWLGNLQFSDTLAIRSLPTFYNEYLRIYSTSTHYSAELSILVFPDDIIENGTFNQKYAYGTDNYLCATMVTLGVDYKMIDGVLTPYFMEVAYSSTQQSDCSSLGVSMLFADETKPFDMNGSLAEELDTTNPYAQGGQSGTGGGDGIYGGIDDIDGTDIPGLPTVTAADLGFITIYNPTKAQLKSLSSYMWSNLFDLDSYKKLFSDPMESIIGLAIVPVAPTVSGTKTVTFGGIDSGVSMSYCSSQYVQLNCGSVSIDKYVGSFLDYSPYTKISIYLPYIGIHELSADDLMGDSVQVVYNIDVLSGACGCFIKSSSKGVLYSFNGSCISNIPLTSINFSSAIQNAVSAVCSGAAVIAGISTGAAPITAMGAAGLLNSACNTAINSKPTVQRSGSLGGSAGVLSVQKPYIIIERPDFSVPYNFNHYVGQASNITSTLGSLTGFTICEYVHIEGVPATEEEIREIEQLLKEGVYL